MYSFTVCSVFFFHCNHVVDWRGKHRRFGRLYSLYDMFAINQEILGARFDVNVIIVVDRIYVK